MLAIVIPYYKINFFESTLISLANQTNKKFNVYIGNDNSTNDPSHLIEKYKNTISIKYKKFPNNLGKTSLVTHWNRCIEMIDFEEWVMILGDDDVLSKDVVKMFYNYLDEFDKVINVVRFSSCKINDQGEEISSVYLNPRIELSTDFLFRESRSSLSEYVFNKKQINKIGFKKFPLAWFSDKLAILEFSNFKNIFSINDAVVYVRISDQSISGVQSNYKDKLNATFDFYYYLLSTKKNFFTKFQQKKLIEQLVKTYLNDKKKGVKFLKTTKIFLVNLYMLDYLRFIKSIFYV
jgi:hypothetical protein